MLFIPLLVVNLLFLLLLAKLPFNVIAHKFLYKFILYLLKLHIVILMRIDLTALSGCLRWSTICWRPVPIC